MGGWGGGNGLSGYVANPSCLVERRLIGQQQKVQQRRRLRQHLQRQQQQQKALPTCAM